MQSAAKMSKLFHADQIQNVGQLKNVLQEITINQINDLESKIYNGQNLQEFANRDISKFISFDSHFHLYHVPSLL